MSANLPRLLATPLVLFLWAASPPPEADPERAQAYWETVCEDCDERVRKHCVARGWIRSTRDDATLTVAGDRVATQVQRRIATWGLPYVPRLCCNRTPLPAS